MELRSLFHLNHSVGTPIQLLKQNRCSNLIIHNQHLIAKENGLDPYRYLVWVLKEAPNRFNTDRAWATTLLPQFTPSACKTNTAEVSANN